MGSFHPRPSLCKHKRDPPPWNNRHEDLKRAALSSLDKDLQQWKHGHAVAKGDLNGDGSMNLSRLDKARSFAIKEAAHRFGANPENLLLSNAERSGDYDDRRPGPACEEGGLDKVKMQKSSAQKGYGDALRHDEKKEPVSLPKVEQDVCSGKNSHGKISGHVAPYRSSSLGTEKPYLKQATPCDKNESRRPSHRTSSGTESASLKHSMLYNNTSMAPSRTNSSGSERPGLKRTSGGDTISLNSGRKLTEKVPLMNKDFKRIIKLKAKISADNGSKDVVRSCVKEENTAVCSPKDIKNEEKQSGCSSKSFNGSSDEHSWKSFSSVKNQKLSPPSSEQMSDRKGLETPVAFLHVARRARSERRRDDSSRSQSSKGVSLDGFGAELEEALLKKQEAEVDSGAQLGPGTQNSMVETGAVTSSISTDAQAEIVCQRQDSQTPNLIQANEREEGELEPEDEMVEKHPLEAGSDLKEDAGHDLQVERNLGKCGEMVDLGVGEMRNDVNEHETIASANILKSQDICALGMDGISASMQRKDKGQACNRDCGAHGEILHQCEKDDSHVNRQCKVSSPSTTMEVKNKASPVHADSDISLHRSNSDLNAKGFESSQQTILSLSTTQAFETITRVSKDDSLELPKFCAKSGGEHLNDEFHVQMENGGRKDTASYVQEGDEHFAYEHRQKKLKVDSLQLSLSLPGYPVAPAKSPPPGSPGHVDHKRSSTHLSRLTHVLAEFQTETASDGFTTSLSLSSFVHNPSCSLNFTMIEDQELSCGGSRPIAQGRVTSGGMLKGPSDLNRSMSSLSRDKQKHSVEAPSSLQILQNGKFQGSAGLSSHTEGNKILESNQAAPRNHQITLGTAAQASESRGSIQQDRAEKLFNQAQPQPRVLSKSVGEPPSSANIDGRERIKESLREIKSLSSEKVGLLEICSEPVAAMAQKLQELPDSFLEGLKGLVKELLGSFMKRDEFLSLQQIIRSRMDLTEETLLRAHPTQLEILVALKTGMQSFVQQGAKTLTYKALIEIFFQTRCRNVDCQQSLPVDGCECKVCSRKKGFCHECMCMVCSKFDSDSNTSRWVGCDLCMHWCHTDCGLRMSHIKSTSVSQKSSEMQFRCLSCDHYMELYGFVKGVFENFAASWSAETLAKELDCVRRIFHASEDARGKQLRWKAEEMLQKLENNVAACDVCSSMLQFFTGCAELDKADHASPRKARLQQPSETSDKNADDGKGDFVTMGSIVARKLSNLVEVYDNKEVMGRKSGAVDAQKGAREGVEQDLHKMIGVKLTDVLMYQARADAAREDATKLQRTIHLKARRMEEDFSLKCARLRLDEAEGRRRKLLEELQTLEKSQREFEAMKVRIESDMKHLTVMSNLQLA